MDIQAYIQSGIIESYVLGIASAEEVAELEILQLQFPEVAEAVSEFSSSIEEYSLKNAIAPPPVVKSNTMAAIKKEQTFPPVISLPTGAPPTAVISAKHYSILRMFAAASVILFLVSGGLNLYLYKQYSQKSGDYRALLAERNSLLVNNQVYQTHLRQWQSAAEMMADPAMAMIKMKGTAGREQNLATIFWNTTNKDVYLMPNKLPHPSKGKQFQLWALVNGKPVDAGMLSPDCEGVCKMKNIPQAQAFAITLENEGGSPTPNMQEMYVLGKV